MNMQLSIPLPPLPEQGELSRHAAIVRQLGSSFVAAILEAGDRQLDRAPITAALIRHWPGDASLDAVAMRFNAALHALARQRVSPRLSALYAQQHDDFDGAIGAALEAHDTVISASIRHVTQTNEVGRSGAIAAALLVARRRFGLPFALNELGASCGLNLNLGLYGFRFGAVRAGVQDSVVQVTPSWTGPDLANAPLEIMSARGVDLNPLKATDRDARERLLSYIWADQPLRARRLEHALALAQDRLPQVDQGDAVPWLADRLSDPGEDDVCRVVYHSMFMQYLTADRRDDIVRMMRSAGRSATVRRPLAWISFERAQARYEVHLTLTLWPEGESRVLATCHAYGDWISWHG